MAKPDTWESCFEKIATQESKRRDAKQGEVASTLQAIRKRTAEKKEQKAAETQRSIGRRSKDTLASANRDNSNQSQYPSCYNMFGRIPKRTYSSSLSSSSTLRSSPPTSTSVFGASDDGGDDSLDCLKNPRVNPKLSAKKQPDQGSQRPTQRSPPSMFGENDDEGDDSLDWLNDPRINPKLGTQGKPPKNSQQTRERSDKRKRDNGGPDEGKRYPKRFRT